MKVAVVFVLLFATVLCRSVKKVSLSSSESSEEVVRRPAAQPLRKKAAEVPQYRAVPVQNVVAAAAPGSDESAESSDEDEQAAALELKSEITDTTSSPDTATVDSQDSEDSDDDDDDNDDDAEETEEDDTSESTESGESSTPAPATLTPVIVTEEPVAEATAEPIEPTIVTDDTARGDSLGGYPSDYKSIVYVEEKTYHKIPSPYKSYEYMGTGKKMANDMTEDNEVDKSMKVYKVQALQVHNEIVEEDTSTPDVESQGLDASSGTAQDQDTRQAALPEEEESASASDATTSESSSAPEEEEEEESASNSASQESEDDDSQSSEEATATPGAADSDSDESDESDEVAAPDATTDMPAVITAK